MTMRRIAAFLICLMPVALHGEDRTITTDGTWWTSLTKMEKLIFIQGYTAGFFDGIGDLSAAITHSHNVVPSSAMQEAEGMGPDSISFGAVVEGVDKCYGDFRNSRLDVSTCVIWTVDGVKGVDDGKRDRYLQLMRQAVSK